MCRGHSACPRAPRGDHPRADDARRRRSDVQRERPGSRRPAACRLWTGRGANEVGDADAQQAHRRVELEVGEQPPCDRPDHRGVARVSVDGARPGVGPERPQPDLQRDRASRVAGVGEAAATSSASSLQGPVQKRAIRYVVGKGRLAALRLPLALGHHRTLVFAPVRARGAPARVAGRRRARATASPAAASSATVRMPRLCQALSGAWPDARNELGRPLARPPRASARAPARRGHRACRGRRRSSRSSLFGASPTEQTRRVSVTSISRFSCRARAFGRRAVREVEVRLVQAGDLDAVAEPAQDLHHLARRRGDRGHVARDQDRLRAAPVGDRQGQRGMDAEFGAPRRRRPSRPPGRRRRSRSRPPRAYRAARAAAGAPRRRRRRPCRRGRSCAPCCDRRTGG